MTCLSINEKNFKAEKFLTKISTALKVRLQNISVSLCIIRLLLYYTEEDNIKDYKEEDTNVDDRYKGEDDDIISTGPEDKYRRVVGNVIFTDDADPTNSPDCPKKDPLSIQTCNWEGYCRYDRFCCCGKCLYTTLQRCRNGHILTMLPDPDFDCGC